MRQLLALLLTAAAAAGQVVHVEAESLACQGSWSPQTGLTNAFGPVLICTDVTDALPAVGAINLPAAGAWRLWVRSKDFPEDRPGTRRFAIELGGRRSAVEFGQHANPDPGAHGMGWEDGGLFDLPAGPLVIAAIPLTGYCRFDALTLIRGDGARPRSAGEAGRLAAEPVELTLEGGGVEATDVQLGPLGGELARLADDRVRVTFAQTTAAGRPAVAVRVEARAGDGWREVVPPSLERYRVLEAPAETELILAGGSSWQWPGWRPGRTARLTAGLGPVRYRTSVGGERWLTAAGQTHWLTPATVTRREGAVHLTAESEGGRAEAVWSLVPGSPLPRVEVTFRPAREGVWGLGYGVGAPLAPGEVDEILCPYLYQYRRFPSEPVLVSYETTPTPLAVYERAGTVWGLAFEPDYLPSTWPDVRQLECGFQLADERGRLQTSAWGPVPGGVGSRLAAGQLARLRVRLVARTGDVCDAWRDVAEGLYGLRDYRRNADLSLTDTALNVIDLLADADHAGWSDDGLGFWNIESPSTVTQAAPLAVLSAAYLTGDERLLQTRALPSLAHLASRPGIHFSTVPGPSGGFGDTRLGGPMNLYGSMVRAGAAAMCRGYSPVFDRLLLADGAPRKTGGYNKHQLYEDALAAWRRTGDEAFRQAAVADLNRYLETWIAEQTVPVDPVNFYQLRFTGNWEGLVEAAELLGDRRALEQARHIAERMITGLFCHPAPVEDEIVVHRGGVFEGNGIAWWRGADLFCLGVDLRGLTGDDFASRRIPPVAAPEEKLPGWRTSIVGLGIEQPTTYRRVRVNCSPIIMANYAANLLRLEALTGEPAFGVAARNSLIGRWGNYPGYYITDFNALMGRADYPLRGPDVSGIYYHHIPPFLALVLDYLATDVEVRSGGAIHFPYERQAGYAWFDNRVRGHRPGTVYDAEGAWLWLRRGLVELDTPLLNWLAAHTADTVYLMLTNTADQPVTATVRLAPEATGGAAGPVALRAGESWQPVALTAGSARVTVPAGGLTVLRWAGCRVDVPLHRLPPPADLPPLPAVEGLLLERLGVGPEQGALHVLSTVLGAEALEVELTQAGQTRRWRDETWPLEILAPVTVGPLTGRIRATAGGRPVAETPLVW